MILLNFFAGYIKTLVKNDQRLKALNYVTTFKMAKEISIVKIIQGHLKGLENNCQKMLMDGEDRKAAEVRTKNLFSVWFIFFFCLLIYIKKPVSSCIEKLV